MFSFFTLLALVITWVPDFAMRFNATITGQSELSTTYS